MRLPIRTKITLPYLFLAIAIALGAVWLVSQVVLDSVEERFTNQLIETGFQASEILARQEQGLLEDLRTLAFTAGLGESIKQRQLDRIGELILPSVYNTDIHAFAILDRAGREIFSGISVEESFAYEPFANSTNWIEWPIVRSVESEQVDNQGDKYSGLIAIGDTEFLFVAGPIPDGNGGMAGIALAGKSVRDLVNAIQRETLADTSFYLLDGGQSISTFEDDMPLEGGLMNLLIESSEQGSATRPTQQGAVAYTELLIPAKVRGGEVIGFLGVALPNSFISLTSSITRGDTLLLIGIVLVVVVAVGIIVARVITGPIQNLREAAEKVSRGDLSIQVETGGSDEVGVLANSFNEMVRSVSQSKQDIIRAYDLTIEGWSKALDLRDHATEGHSQRVTEMTLKLAHRLDIPDERMVDIRRGALLHDIGKIGIPDSILLKEGPLTEDEIQVMRRHPEFGREFMYQIDFLSPALDIPYCHHEKWDGSGYPQGLEGEEIPKEARIFALVDVWDAITTDRPYRKAMSFEEALAVIEKGIGSHFDPEIVNTFLEMVSEERGGWDAEMEAGRVSLEELGLSPRIVDALVANGVSNTQVLLNLLEEDQAKLLEIKGIGEKSLENILQSFENEDS